MCESTPQPDRGAAPGPAARDRPHYYYDLLQGQEIARAGDHVWGWGSPGGRKRAARRARMFVDHGRLEPGVWALEVGCGTGIFTEQVVTASRARVVAFDVSFDLIRLARAKPGNAGARFVVADAEALPFAADTFAAAYGSSVLHHLDVEGSLLELRRVARPGGRVVFTEPNMMNPQIVLQKNVPAIGRAVGDIPGETAFVRWPMRRLLDRLGFTDLLVEPFDFLHPLLPAFCVDAVDGFTRLLERVPLLREIAGSLLIVCRKPE